MQIEVGGAELFDELQPLWEALFDHHHSVGDAGLAVIPRDESWPLRRAHYERLCAAHPWVSVWLVRDDADSAPLGYALAFEEELGGRRACVLETLSLLPAARGAGLGSELMRLVAEAAVTRGCSLGVIDVMGGNARARAFYLRAGFVPVSEAWMRSTPTSEHGSASPGESGQLTSDADLASRSAAMGFDLEILPGPDDSWVSSDRLASLSPHDPDRDWLPGELDRLCAALEAAGLWTVIVEVPASPRGGALRRALVGEDFRLSMERVVRELR